MTLAPWRYRTIGPRTIVSQFVKWGSDPIRLWAFTVLQDVEWPDGRVTRSTREEYDVVWSRRDGYLFHNSGCGGGPLVEVMGHYHVSGDAAVIRERAATWCSARDRPPWLGKRTQKIRRRNATRRLRQLPLCIDGMQPGWDILDWLENNAIQEDAVYCAECDDWLSGESNEPCDHVWWCDKSGWWSTPSERCRCGSRAVCSGEEETSAARC